MVRDSLFCFDTQGSKYVCMYIYILDMYNVHMSICTHTYLAMSFGVVPMSVCCHSRFLFCPPAQFSHFPHFHCDCVWCALFLPKQKFSLMQYVQTTRPANGHQKGPNANGWCPVSGLPFHTPPPQPLFLPHPFATRPSRTNFGHNNNCGHYEAKPCDAKSHTHTCALAEKAGACAIKIK